MKHTSVLFFLILAWVCFNHLKLLAQHKPVSFRVVGYYSGSTIPPDSFETRKLTHLIFCFCHLNGNRLHIGSATDSVIIRQMVALKNGHPQLKVMLSLGGWGGCETCSAVFNSAAGRKAFAESVRDISRYFNTDGIDLDWEYPAVKGYPGHLYQKADKANFTLLLQQLRKANGALFEISFAAGGYSEYIFSAIEWKKILPYTNFINIMSYDLVHGFSTKSGHHTPLYSTKQQLESTDHAVRLLLGKGVPAEKLVIGAAFYGRFFSIDSGHKVDLYMPCKFSHAFSSKDAADSLSIESGFKKYWDEQAQAPYAIHTQRRLLATYDDERSVALKTKYAINNQLGGIMFWQLYDDKLRDGLLNIIFRNK